MSRLRALWRLLRVLAHLVRGLWMVLRHFPRLTSLAQQEHVVAWSRRLLGIFDVRLVLRGNSAVSGPLLLVSNHISWLDITVLHASRFCRFISKGDVKNWPVLGALARGIGTLFIERDSRRDAMRVVHHMAERLRAGDVLAVFPEGTTGDGTGLLPFHANLLQAAISAHAPIQPVAIQYLDRATGLASRVAAYLGDDHLLVSIWRILCASDLSVVVTFGAVQNANGRDRRAWAGDLHEVISGLRA